MSANRIQRALLSKDFVLNHIAKIRVKLSTEDKVLGNFTKNALPLLRYANPSLSVEVENHMVSGRSNIELFLKDGKIETINPEDFESYHFVVEQILHTDKNNG